LRLLVHFPESLRTHEADATDAIHVEGRALVQGLGEGLLILGWVAMWRPVEILLFEHWERHLDHALLERLGSIPIAFVFRPDAAGTRVTGPSSA